ncbi:hypothetical protein ACVR05_03390 [Streptococcus caprae]|uniref:GNAT family N-acetyltransferase n=1 Tax=Streptococcus caprae TaxID=1640501 RepID=A0ABV8CSQ6_9STRE
MWEELTRQNYQYYLPLAYEWSQKIEQTAFPLFCDGVKTRDDFYRWAQEGIERENEHLLIYKIGNQPIAWIHYFVLQDEKQLGLCTFFIIKSVATVMSDLMQLFQQFYCQYKLIFYVPHQNYHLCTVLDQIGQKIDKQYVDIAHLDNLTAQDSIETVQLVTSENRTQLNDLLAKIEYGNHIAERLLTEPHIWDVFIYLSNHQPIAILYASHKNPIIHEIFGIVTIKKVTEGVIADLVRASLSHSRSNEARFLYFFTDDKEHAIVSQLGFKMLTKAICYQILF